MTTGVWHCVQWEYDGSGTPAKDDAKVWVDGVLAVEATPAKGWKLATPWSAFDFGFTHYQTLAAGVDILVCCAMGGPATLGLIDRAAIEALPEGAIFVNVSRGSVVDEAALLEALRSRRIAAAGLDVFWNEPAIDPAFAQFPHVVLAPHAASGTEETRRAMGLLMRDNLAAHFAGRPLPTEITP